MYLLSMKIDRRGDNYTREREKETGWGEMEKINKNYYFLIKNDSEIL